MQQERVEEYLGAIYRLRAAPETPLPLSQLTEYFGFSAVSVHEMVQNRVEVVPVGEMEFKGHPEAEPIFEVVSVSL